MLLLRVLYQSGAMFEGTGAVETHEFIGMPFERGSGRTLYYNCQQFDEFLSLMDLFVAL